jgi:uncharacterized protein (TIGR02246 family)
MPPPVHAPLGSPDDIEQQFYEALQRADIEQFMAVWADDEEISCVHPGGQRLIGAGAIRAAFEALLSNGSIDLRPERVRRLLTHTCAVHSLVEQIRIQTAEGVQAAWIIVTNVYVKGAQGWRLVAHHASPGAPHEVQDVTETASVLH